MPIPEYLAGCPGMGQPVQIQFHSAGWFDYAENCVGTYHVFRQNNELMLEFRENYPAKDDPVTSIVYRYTIQGTRLTLIHPNGQSYVYQWQAQRWSTGDMLK